MSKSICGDPVYDALGHLTKEQVGDAPECQDLTVHGVLPQKILHQD